MATEHITFLRGLIDELRNQRDDARDDALALRTRLQRAETRVQWLETALQDELILRNVDTGSSQAARRW